MVFLDELYVMQAAPESRTEKMTNSSGTTSIIVKEKARRLFGN
jgi:hypothetical protein